jgi:hypothetical protein
MVEDSPAARTPISGELRAQIRALLAAFPQGLPASRTVLFIIFILKFSCKKFK